MSGAHNKCVCTIGQVLKEKDTDKDGELSFQEYVGDRGQGKDKEWLISEKERFVGYSTKGSLRCKAFQV